MEKKTVKYKLLHAHGSAGPRGKRSYIQFGTYKSKENAKKNAKAYRLDGYKIVPMSKVKKTKYKGLYYI